MDTLLRIDTALFSFINHLPYVSLAHFIAPALSGVGAAGIIWFLLAIILFLKEEKKDHWFFMPVGLSGGASLIIVELILKPLIGRIRPDGSDGFSFPSGHATIAFAMAVVLSRKEPKWKWAFYTLAVFISLSRIYLGVHYPLDVIAGGVLGWGIGWLSRAKIMIA